MSVLCVSLCPVVARHADTHHVHAAKRKVVAPRRLPMYCESAFFSDIDILLRTAGFSFIDFHKLTRYEYVKVPARTGERERLIWGDAVFFRDLPLRPESHVHLAAQAKIASLVYHKHGLAQKLVGMAAQASAM